MRSITPSEQRVSEGESNPHSLVHSQACRNRYTTDTILLVQLARPGFEPGTPR